MSDFKVSFGFTQTDKTPEPGPPPEPTGPAPDDTIEFLCDPELLGKIPAPERSIRSAPEWFKRLDREMGMKDANGLPGLTVKACLPVTDTFSLGYMIPLPFDVQLHIPEDRVSIQMGWAPDVPFQPIEQHHPAQIGAPEPPFESTMPLKFINPWRIKVPDGYSVLFAQPLSRPDLPFTCFTGMVDCDRFDTTVNIPFVWTGPTGEHLLPAGTPIAQCIPIKRDALLKQTTARASTPEELAEQAAAKQRKYHEESTYARDWRVKK
ncbi:hypothetical protein QWY75_07220 [Pontixanthobacter aestiaquae]|uniref:Uncharacterized protein n=1 Tax=Pontixanthobacter aestiaquae TaxID=1509367 RepID=A0A844Z515_9SPHN|nr:hypothetical protein [Pontixanthobacter aestiaquae]MDN3645992.1 hypothetical protein [Pontixanthobacter aestiaquae]MXO83015.1 hypothetical protein [Pontixanthobacter aestiaquae]